MFAVLSAGPERSDKPTVLLAPGWTGSKEDFLTLLPEVAVTGRRVVAYDQRGQMETPGPDDLDAYSLDALADDLLSIAEAVSDRPVDVVGHSFGGLVASRATIRKPLALNSLVLMCSGPGALPADQHSGLQDLDEALSDSSPSDVWTRMRELEEASGTEMPPADIEQWLRRRFLASSPIGLRAKTRHLMNAPDDRDMLRDIPAPMLVLTGAADDAWPVEVQASLARDLGAAHVVLDGLGHSPAVEDPGRTAGALVAFWDTWLPARPVLDVQLISGTSDVPVARHLMRDALEGVMAPERLDEAELLASEVVTNAILHACPPVTMTCTVRGGMLATVVSDAGGGTELAERVHHGRGLPIVTSLAQRCGSWSTDAGVTVWFWLPIDEAPAEAPACGNGYPFHNPAQDSAAGPSAAPSGHES